MPPEQPTEPTEPTHSKGDWVTICDHPVYGVDAFPIPRMGCIVMTSGGTVFIPGAIIKTDGFGVRRLGTR